MALENPNVTADAVAINEYPQLAQRYRVMGVPKTMINGRDGIEGALPEDAFVESIVLAATESGPPGPQSADLRSGDREQ